MYVLHIANKNYSSWSLRAWLLLTELGIPFEERMANLAPGAPSNWQAFRAFSPNGRVPCLHDGGIAVWETPAIAEYLAERHAGVWPQEARARAWARSAVAEMHAGFAALRNICGMNCGVRVRLRGIDAALQADLDRLDELWREGLERHGGPFLAGARFGAVDAFFAPVAFRIQTYGLPLGAEATAYAARLRALPGMRRWYAQALAEREREPIHEAETVAHGELVEDLREA